MLSLRPVETDDCQLLWEWANDPDVRAVSFVPGPIAWDVHVEWFRTKMKDSSVRLFIALEGETPIGQLRYELQGREAVASISLDRAARGKGFGTSVIRLGSRLVFQTLNADVIHAFVKEGNEASLRAFLKAGFNHEGRTTVCDQQAIHVMIRKSD